MIKKLLIIGVFVSFYGKIWGQNLVPNGDFEQYTSCPNYIGQIDSVLFWMNPSIYPGSGGSPDYFNQCDTVTPLVGIPENAFGYQNAYSGSGYTGLALFDNPFTDFREYIEVSFTSSLLANTCYHFEMHFSLANESNATTNALGIYFSNVAITGINNCLPLPFTPQINNTIGLFTDTLNWTLFSGNFTATGNESHLIIGNFLWDTNTLMIPINNNGILNGTYIYIDDVSLTVCTGINENNPQTEITIYPNPAGEYLEIRNSKHEIRNNEINIYDMMGKEVQTMSNNIKQSQTKINISTLSKGIYFIEINGERKKFVKQ